MMLSDRTNVQELHEIEVEQQKLDSNQRDENQIQRLIGNNQRLSTAKEKRFGFGSDYKCMNGQSHVFVGEVLVPIDRNI